MAFNVDAGTLEYASELGRELAVQVDDQVALAAEEPTDRIRQVACDLRHEWTVRIGRDARDMNSPSRMVDDEEHVVRGEATGSPDFGGEEVRSHYYIGMRPQEGAPRHGALRAWSDAIVLQRLRDCRSGDPVVELLQLTLDAAVSPA